MRFTSTTIVSLDSVTISDLRGIERKCAECNQLFEDGDLVMAFSVSTYQDDSLPLEDVYLAHIKKKTKTGGTCVDDFVARVVNGLPDAIVGESPPAPEPVEEKSAETPPPAAS
jgi:hypothetical protein